MAKHSQIGASSAYRWFECPGSVALCAQVPEQEQNEYARIGSLAHAVIAERFADPEKDIVIPDDLNEEDVQAVNTFLDVIDEDRAKGKFIFYSEVTFALDRVLPGLFGTCDVVLLSSDLSKLVVYDYKHGAGVPVEVEDNDQLMYYALGAIQEADKKHCEGMLDVLGWGNVFQSVEVVIVQPRCRHKDGVVRRWKVSADKLNNFAEMLRKKALEAQTQGAPLNPGDHCRFCPAQAVCPAIAEKSLAVAQSDFADVQTGKAITLPDPATLTKADLSKIMAFTPVMESWLKAVEGHALELLQHGEDVPGFKLVKKRANRAWKEEQAAIDALSLYLSDDQLWEKKLLTPAKVEKLLKKDKKIVADLVVVPDNGNTIAPEHDPREPVKGTAQTDFGQIEQENRK